MIDFVDTVNGYQATRFTVLDDLAGEGLIATLDYTENEDGRGYWSIVVRYQANWGGDMQLVFRVSDQFDRAEEDYLSPDADVIDAEDWLHEALVEAKVLLGRLRRWDGAGATMFDGIALGAEWRWSDLAISPRR